MARFFLVRFVAAVIAVLVFTLTLLAASTVARSAHGAEPRPTPAPSGATCRTVFGPWTQTVDAHGRTVLRRESRTVCVGPVAPAR
jgi:hypothetical protein